MGVGALVRTRGRDLLAAHERVHEALKGKGVRHRVEPRLPVDVLGAYVYLPEGAA